MCTTTCPCPQPLTYTANPNWYNLFTANASFEVAANSYNRTISTTPSTYNPNLVPFTFASGNTSYDNFAACYAAVTSIDNTLSSSNPSYQKRITQVSADFTNFASNVESALNCNGICTPGLFYYFKTIASGPPTSNCITGLQTIFAGKPVGIGVILLISVFMIMLTNFAAWSMCCRCCAPKEVKDQWKDWKDYK